MSCKHFAAHCAALFACFSLLSAPDASAQTTVRVNLSISSSEANADSYRPKISADGRWVVYSSNASNLVSSDTNNQTDIFLTEIGTNITRRVNVSSNGDQAVGGGSYSPVVSGNGRYVAFESLATNLVSGDTNANFDIFVRDTVLNTTERVSVGVGGAQSNGSSEYPVITRDGRSVAFESGASNLVSGDANTSFDVFLYDRLLKKTTRVSVSSGGTQGTADSYNSAISPDGRWVAFASDTSNLVANDTNSATDVFLRDTVAGTTVRISVASNGAQGDNNSGGSGIFVSDNGQFVAFDSEATTLISGDINAVQDVFVRDLGAGTTSLVSVSSNGADIDNTVYANAISGDGRYVLFSSRASNLVSGDNNGVDDCFLRDRQTNTTLRVSLGTNAVQGNDASSYCDMTPDANAVAFVSYAGNLLGGQDTLDFSDVFVRAPLQTTATLSGTLALQGIVPFAPDQLITFTFHQAAGDTVRTAAVSPNGAFVVNGVPRDVYTLLIKGGSYLAKKVTVDLTSGNVTLPNPIPLKTGDANSDNFSDVADLLLIIAAYNKTLGEGGYNVFADFNLDGVNDVSDLLAQIGNYNQQGDTLP